uniref:Putative secreted peptide n=1 Tax=Anopheles braziliensis TaxID=58242 RepID=A0A2M3ZTJ9_9DIPT
MMMVVQVLVVLVHISTHQSKPYTGWHRADIRAAVSRRSLHLLRKQQPAQDAHRTSVTPSVNTSSTP